MKGRTRVEWCFSITGTTDFIFLSTSGLLNRPQGLPTQKRVHLPVFDELRDGRTRLKQVPAFKVVPEHENKIAKCAWPTSAAKINDPQRLTPVILIWIKNLTKSRSEVKFQFACSTDPLFKTWDAKGQITLVCGGFSSNGRRNTSSWTHLPTCHSRNSPI